MQPKETAEHSWHRLTLCLKSISATADIPAVKYPAPDPALPDMSIAGTFKRTSSQEQWLRVRRLAMASSTYVLGLLVLGLCTSLGLFPRSSWLIVAGLFVTVNLGLLLAFWTKWNLRFEDPSLTALQIYLAVTVVPIILVLGRSTHFVAAPYYAVIFVFGMLQMQARQLATVACWVLLTYCTALIWRYRIYGDALDWRVEMVTATLVVASSVWFAIAASYISSLRGRLQRSLQHIAALATYDGLTGVLNRRHLDQALESAVNQAGRHGTVLCVAMVDVDHFKRVNDSFGHVVGDEVLKAIAGTLVGSVRAGDEVGRYGGEEFLLVLPATTIAQATALADRLRRRLESLQSLPPGEQPVTASFGLAAWRGDESAEDLVRRADQALYRAKAQGRNRVEVDNLFRVMTS